MKTEIYVNITMPGMHCWPAAPEQVAYLQHPHRHLFHITLWMPVSHSDREHEFFIEQNKLHEVVVRCIDLEDCGSCEHMATQILGAIPYASKCEVSEDGENGAVVTR